MRIQLDHIAFGVRKVADTTDFVVGVLGGVPESGGPSPGFWGGQWSFARGERLEILEPDASADGFMRRFVEGRGPGVHHVTFKVPDLAAVCARAERAGYRIVGRNESFPGWREAFLHPKQALGLVVQVAQTDPRYADEDSWSGDWDVPPGPAHPPPPVEIAGLRMSVTGAERARRQWRDVCGGEEREPGVFCWPDSPLQIACDVDPDAPEGPRAIELRSARELALPDGPVRALGARFSRIG